MFDSFLPSLRMLVVLSVLTGVVYPLVDLGHRAARVSRAPPTAA